MTMDKKVRHTPGKWRTDEKEYSQYVFGPDGEMICEMRGWGYLTGRRRNLSDIEAAKIQAANCKLIAAAPQLLEALESICGIQAFISDPKMKDVFVDKVYNAIKLAKDGES